MDFYIENWDEVSLLDFMTRYGNQSNTVRNAECSRKWPMGDVVVVVDVVDVAITATML